MKTKKALIFGITGQDGSYLARFLLKKKYIVHGIKRRSSSLNTSRIDDIYEEPFVNLKRKFILHYGDITDSTSVVNIIKQVRPDEIYNLAAQSHVQVSFEIPEYTANADALGALRILEAIKILNLKSKVKFYQAGTSEMYGNSSIKSLNEQSQFYPRSPYGAAKVYAHWITKNYREAYGIFASNGILFNHESPLRGETFVTKKIIKGLCEIKFGKRKKIILGNLYAKRDWGHAKDYVKAMWLILQYKKPEDFIIATNNTTSIKNFINLVCKKLKFKIYWSGKNLNECAKDKKGNKIITINKKYFRPTEVNVLKGNYSKAKRLLKWKPKIKLNELISEMINYEIKKLNNKYKN